MDRGFLRSDVQLTPIMHRPYICTFTQADDNTILYHSRFTYTCIQDQPYLLVHLKLAWQTCYEISLGYIILPKFLHLIVDSVNNITHSVLAYTVRIVVVFSEPSGGWGGGRGG